MKKKILVIFFISVLLSILIYNLFKNKPQKILIISDNESSLKYKLDETYQISIYNYNKITYKQLINNIKNNDYKIIKNDKVYLNQLISSSNIIILNINNHEYFKKCKKNNNIINNYDELLSMNINDLYFILKKISNANIYIVGNYCKNKNHEQLLKIPYKYIKYTDISENIK